ncbi:unnamed protein product [Blepharisma stoltei]|uniref:Importin subunit alpha n=1 Tax=Blepharisma stoltei TaxID=1481888 RepID=A0AAU9JHX6_9CILI|nr:unnamed protein product [Blepharisma stoltei]
MTDINFGGKIDYGRLEDRNNYFMKVDSYELIKRAENLSVNLRKDKRIKHMAQKRGLKSADTNIEENDFGLIPNYGKLKQQERLNALILSMGIIHNDYNTLIYLKQFRKILNETSEENYKEMLSKECIQTLTKYLDCGYSDEISSEVALSLVMITKGSHNQTEELVKNNFIEILMNSISLQKPKTTEYSFYALSNILGDCKEFKEILIKKYEFFEFLMPYGQWALQENNIELLKGIFYCVLNIASSLKSFDLLKRIWNFIIQFTYIEDSSIIEVILWIFHYCLTSDLSGVNELVNEVILRWILSKFASDNSIIAVKVIGDTSYFDLTQLLLKLDTLDCLYDLYRGSITPTQKFDICYIISNIVGENNSYTHNVITHPIIRKIIKALSSQHSDVVLEASWVFYNISRTAKNEDIMVLVDDKNIFSEIGEVLIDSDSQVVLNLLCFVERALKVGKINADKNHEDVNKVCCLIDDSNCLNALENLQSYRNERVYDFAMEIMTDFFGFEDNFVNFENVPDKFEFS